MFGASDGDGMTSPIARRSSSRGAHSVPWKGHPDPGRFKVSTPPMMSVLRGRSGSLSADAREERRRRLAERCINRVRSERRGRLQRMRMQSLESDDRESGFKQATRTAISNEFENNLTPEDLLLVEQQIIQELWQEEEEAMIEYERREREKAQLELDYYAEFSQNCNDQVVCPICCTENLHNTDSVFHCACGFRLDTKNECFSLEQFRERLANAHSGHYENNPTCTRRPVFNIMDRFGPKILECRCVNCGFCSVVM
mmetsp:Transcript_2246/g.4275  ORF Transcript_2246/g.4275 Transcript_2246/m.4275 type:complete len:256 (-) Transcript_2246:1383-2150(-)